MPLIMPTRPTQIGFRFGPTSFAAYPDDTWHGIFMPHFHGGIDYWGTTGQTIMAAAAGYVWYAGYAVPYIGSLGGNGIVIKHTANMWTVYAHLNTVEVDPGQQVVAGQRIAGMNASGQANGVTHLHFELWTNTPTWGIERDNPEDYYVGGTQQQYFLAPDDIPILEPVTGSTITHATCTPLGNNTFAPPATAGQITAVYVDNHLLSLDQYTIGRVVSTGNEYVRINYAVGADSIVSVDFVVA